jgi:predicted GNAT family acetyltransferase
MKILHEEKGGTGRHYLNDEKGNTVAEITYSNANGKVIIVDHTGVDPELQGKNIGQDLVQAVVEQARAEGKKIMPVCTFAKAVLGKSDQFKDVLAEG